MPPLLEALDAGVLTVTLHRPDQGNTLDRATIDALHAAIERAELDASVRVVAVRGAGKDFCLGADLDEPATARFTELVRRLGALPRPVVAVVQGRALADGAALATACDIVLAADSATFAYPGVERGAVPAVAIAALRRVAAEKLALDLALTGRVLPASAAAAAGLVTRTVPDGDLERHASALLTALAAANPSALALTKRLVRQLHDMSPAEGMAVAARVDSISRVLPH